VALYRLPDLEAAPADATVYLCEGEADTDALAERGLLAVGTMTGAATIPCDDSLAPLIGRDVVLWPDADEPGRGHMANIAARLAVLER
jgi:putative DNA primase/helicase